MNLVRNPLPCCWSSRVEKRKLLDPVGALKEKFLRPSAPLFHPQVSSRHLHRHKSRKALGLLLGRNSKWYMHFEQNLQQGSTKQGN